MFLLLFCCCANNRSFEIAAYKMAMLYLHRTEHVFGKLIEIIVCKYYTSVHIISQSNDLGCSRPGGVKLTEIIVCKYYSNVHSFSKSWCRVYLTRGVKLSEIIVCKYYTSVHIISQSDDFGQVVHTNVPLSPSSITWYQPRGGDSD